MDTAIPTRITQGDTPTWTETLEDYPVAAGWSLRYVLAGPQSITVQPSQSSGTAYTFAPVTNTWQPGLYGWQRKVLNTDGRKLTLDSGQISIETNLEGAAAGAVVQTKTQQELALIDEAIRRRLAGLDVEELRIGTRTYVRPALEVLYDLRNRLQARADAQARKPRKSLIRFGPRRIEPPRIEN